MSQPKSLQQIELEKPIMERLFLVMVPVVATYTTAEVKEYGISGERNPLNNKSMVDSLTQVWLPIIRLLEIYESGMSVRTMDKSTVTSMYTVMDTYIGHINNFQGITIHNALPNDELAKRLMAFSRDVFQLNLREIVDELNVAQSKDRGIGSGINTTKPLPPELRPMGKGGTKKSNTKYAGITFNDDSLKNTKEMKKRTSGTNTNMSTKEVNSMLSLDGLF